MEALTITIGVLILSLSVALSAVARYSIRSTSFEEALRSHNFRTQFNRVLATKAANRKKKTTRRRFVRNRLPVDGDNQLESGNETDNSGISGSALPSAESQDDAEVHVVEEAKVRQVTKKSNKKNKSTGGKGSQRSVEDACSPLTPVVGDTVTEIGVGVGVVGVVGSTSLRVENDTKRVSTGSAAPGSDASPDGKNVEVVRVDMRVTTLGDEGQNHRTTVVKPGVSQRETPALKLDDVSKC